MKFIGVRKILEGKFITRYDVEYVTAEGNGKTYEMISRNPNIQTLEDLQNKTPDNSYSDHTARSCADFWTSFYDGRPGASVGAEKNPVDRKASFLHAAAASVL